MPAAMVRAQPLHSILLPLTLFHIGTSPVGLPGTSKWGWTNISYCNWGGLCGSSVTKPRHHCSDRVDRLGCIWDQCHHNSFCLISYLACLFHRSYLPKSSSPNFLTLFPHPSHTLAFSSSGQPEILGASLSPSKFVYSIISPVTTFHDHDHFWIPLFVYCIIPSIYINSSASLLLSSFVYIIAQTSHRLHRLNPCQSYMCSSPPDMDYTIRYSTSTVLLQHHRVLKHRH